MLDIGFILSGVRFRVRGNVGSVQATFAGGAPAR